MKFVTKKSALFLIILTVFSTSIFSTQKANAQSTGDVLTTALNCSGLLDKAGSALTGAVNSLTGFISEEVPVGDSTLQTKENCFDSIAYTAAKAVLAKITKSTLAWINGGFNGAPSYVLDPGSFFESIAEEQVSSFTANIAFDPSRFPFGRLTAQNIIKSIQNQLDINAAVTEGRLLNYDNDPSVIYKDRFDNFTNDFLYGGGWDGYLAVTQINTANPFDTYIQSVNKIGPIVASSKKNQNPIETVTKELEQSGGFLALKKCVLPTEYESANEDTSFTRATATAQSTSGTAAERAEAREWLRVHTCVRWETKTPGTAIAQELNLSLGSSQRQLEMADELNESISAVFDALIKQLFKKGVSSLSGGSSTGTNVNVQGGYGTNTVKTSLSGASGDAAADAAAEQWYNQNKNFNLKDALAPGGVIDDPDCTYYDPQITTLPHIITNPDGPGNPNCNQGYAAVEYAYAQALEAQNAKLLETISWINYADYCIPGPRPDWLDVAENAINRPKQKLDEAAGDEDEADRVFASLNILWDTLAFRADKDDTNNLRDTANAKGGIDQALKKQEDSGGWGYKEYIESRYSIRNVQMPSSTPLVYQIYRKKSLYYHVIGKNEEAIINATTIAQRLVQIYENILIAEDDFQVGTPNEDTDSWLTFMDSQLKIFSRLITQIKSGAAVVNIAADTALTDQEIQYLSAPSLAGLIFSCVADVSNLPASSNLVRRAYPEITPTNAQFIERGWLSTNSEFISRNWPSGKPVLSESQTFLPGVKISVKNGASDDDSGYIYLGHYLHSCDEDNFETDLEDDAITLSDFGCEAAIGPEPQQSSYGIFIEAWRLDHNEWLANFQDAVHSGATFENFIGVY